MKKAKENPKLPPDKLAAIKKEAEDAVKRELEETVGKELKELRAQLEAAEAAKDTADRAKNDAERNLAEAEKRLKTASPELNTFKTLFESLQECANKCLKQIDKIKANDPESAEKLSLALRAFAERLGHE